MLKPIRNIEIILMTSIIIGVKNNINQNVMHSDFIFYKLFNKSLYNNKEIFINTL